MAPEGVLIPGTLCDERVFAPLVSELSLVARYVSLTGHDRVESAATAILNVAPAHFVAIGFSLGGFVALEIMRHAPERLAGVILLSGNAHSDDPLNAASRRKEVALARDMGVGAVVSANIERFLGSEASGDPAIVETIAAMAETFGPEELASQAEMNIHRPDFRALTAAPPVPLLVVAGAEDQLCSAERYRAAAAGGDLVTLTGCGHFVPLEAPHTTAKVIDRWLRREADA